MPPKELKSKTDIAHRHLTTEFQPALLSIQHDAEKYIADLLSSPQLLVAPNLVKDHLEISERKVQETKHLVMALKEKQERLKEPIRSKLEEIESLQKAKAVFGKLATEPTRVVEAKSNDVAKTESDLRALLGMQPVAVQTPETAKLLLVAAEKARDEVMRSATIMKEEFDEMYGSMNQAKKEKEQVEATLKQTGDELLQARSLIIQYAPITSEEWEEAKKAMDPLPCSI